MGRCGSGSPGMGRSTYSAPTHPRPPSPAFSRSMMPSPIISRTAEPPEDWRAFAAANGTFYHRPEWALCLAEMYGLRLDYYSARQQGELCGLLAVAEIPPLFGPRRYVRLPLRLVAGPRAPAP